VLLRQSDVSREVPQRTGVVIDVFDHVHRDDRVDGLPDVHGTGHFQLHDVDIVAIRVTLRKRLSA
jgi:hypothetical protein